MPGAGEGRRRRQRFKIAVGNRRGQLDQLGTCGRPGCLLLQRLLRGNVKGHRESRLRRSIRQFRQHFRGMGRSRNGRADRTADPRDQRKRRARRILPHTRLPSSNRGGNSRDIVAVDGYLESVELRTLHLRRRRP